MVLHPPLLWLLAGSKAGAPGHSQPISSTTCRKTCQQEVLGWLIKARSQQCTALCCQMPWSCSRIDNIVFGQLLAGHQGTALCYEASQAGGQLAWGACAVSILAGFVNLSRFDVSASEVPKATKCLRWPQSPVYALVARSQCVFFGAFCSARCLFLGLLVFPEHLLSSKILTRPAQGSS